MKPTLNLIAAMAFGCLSSCAGGLKNETALSPSVLNTTASYYNGKTVLVQGYVTLAPEDHTLYESKALDAEATRLWNSGDKNFNALSFEWTRYCLTIANPGVLYKHQSSFNKQTITVKGKFVDDYLTPRTIDLGACPLPTAIVIDYADLQRRYPSLFQKH